MACCPGALIDYEVAAGRLVRLLDAYELVGPTTDIRLAYSTCALLPAKVRAFVEHAVRFCAEQPYVYAKLQIIEVTQE